MKKMGFLIILHLHVLLSPLNCFWLKMMPAILVRESHILVYDSSMLDILQEAFNW